MHNFSRYVILESSRLLGLNACSSFVNKYIPKQSVKKKIEN